MRRWGATVNCREWRRVGGTRPEGGIRLENETLEKLLLSGLTMTAPQWRSTGVSGLHRQHYVWLNGVYYQPKHSVSLSGRPLSPVGERIRIEVRPRQARVMRVTTMRMRREAAGIQPLRDGRWRVACVLSARRLDTGGIVVMVRWAGPPGKYADSEVRLGSMTADLRREARALLPRRASRGVRQAEPAPRRSTRLLGPDGGRGGRRSSRLAQAAGAAADQQQGVQPQAEQEEMGESGSEVEWQGADSEDEARGDGWLWGKDEAAYFEIEEVIGRRQGPAGVQLHVRWGGVDPATKAAYPSSWVDENQLAPALRRQLAQPKVRRARAAREVADRAGQRKREEAAVRRRVEAETRAREAAAEARRRRREMRAEEAELAGEKRPGRERGAESGGVRRSQRLTAAGGAETTTNS